jgi:hypothetical protein
MFFNGLPTMKSTIGNIVKILMPVPNWDIQKNEMKLTKNKSLMKQLCLIREEIKAKHIFTK